MWINAPAGNPRRKGLSAEAVGYSGEDRLIKGVMKREVSVVGPDVWLALAACMMRDQDVGCLPVVEEGRLIGVITDRDIAVRGVAEGLDPHRSMVREVMSASAIACSVEDTVEQARELMAAT